MIWRMYVSAKSVCKAWTSIHVFMHACIRMYIHTYMYTYITYVLTQPCSWSLFVKRGKTYMYTCMHAYIHTYIQHMYSHSPVRGVCS